MKMKYRDEYMKYLIAGISLVVFLVILIRVLNNKMIFQNASINSYITENNIQLDIYIFNSRVKSYETQPAMIFFHGGGWEYGTPKEFFEYAKYFAEKGYICICPEYRILSKYGTSPIDTVNDAINAYQWVRKNTADLKINQEEIILVGGSAGGHLCYWIAYNSVINNIKPKALILLNAALDITQSRCSADLFGDTAEKLSPVHNIIPDFPKTLFIHAENDELIYMSDVNLFKEKMDLAGNDLTVSVIENAPHGIYYWGKKAPAPESVSIMESWLKGSVE